MSLIKFSDFTTNAIKVTQLKNGKFMRNFYLDYEGGVFELQTPKFLLDWGGVPRKDEYHRTDMADVCGHEVSTAHKVYIKNVDADAPKMETED